MSFRRLTGGHWLALVAALALLLAMAPDWYSDEVGETRRFHEERIPAQIDRQTTPTESEAQALAAEEHELNAWQAGGAIDRVILVLLLTTAGLAIAAAFVRAAGRHVRPPSPAALATLIGLVAALLLAYRIAQPPGPNEFAVVKWGAPLAAVCVGLVALGSRIATLSERERPPAEDEAVPEAPAPAR